MDIYCQARSPAGPSLVRRWQLLNNVGCALVYLHSLDPFVVHGDIMGDNVLVAGPTDHVQAKPTDFGLSRLLPGTLAPPAHAPRDSSRLSATPSDHTFAPRTAAVKVAGRLRLPRRLMPQSLCKAKCDSSAATAKCDSVCCDICCKLIVLMLA